MPFTFPGTASYCSNSDLASRSFPGHVSVPIIVLGRYVHGGMILQPVPGIFGDAQFTHSGFDRPTQISGHKFSKICVRTQF